MSSLEQKMSWVLCGRLMELINQDVPIFQRTSPILLEKIVNGSIQFESVGSGLPAFYSDDGSFLIEPEGVNEITWPQRLTQAVWVKGTNVIVQEDRAAAPDGTTRADRITWTGGAGATQVLRRSLSLDPGTTYTLSLYCRLRTNGGQFGVNDVIRMVGGVVGNPTANLNVLNGFAGLYRVIELTFTTAGSIPNVEISATEDYAVTAITTTTVTITLPDVVVTADQLVGARLAFDNDETYSVTANTATSSQNVTVTLDAVNLPGDGISTANRVVVLGPAQQDVDFEVYCESVVSLDWGIVDLKEGSFRSSPINQSGEKTIRADTTIYYRYGPLAGLPSFGFFMDIRYWRGSGVFLETPGFFVWAEDDGRLTCQLQSTPLTTTNPIPSENTKVFIQVSSETTSLSIYVNGRLEARTTVPDVDLAEGPFSLISAGVRCYRKGRIICFSSALTDGGISVGQQAADEVAELFADEDVISASAISSQSPGILLPAVQIPGVEMIAASAITAINLTARTITLEDASNFESNSMLYFLKGESIQSTAMVTARNANVLTLDSVAGVKVGHLAVYGDIDNPGRATVRLPVEAYDAQFIEAVDVGNRRVTVGSAISFDLSTAYVQNQAYADKAGVVIEAIDEVSRTLTLNNVDGIEVGDVIFQPSTELLIDPRNFVVRLQEDYNGVKVERKGRDSIEILNRNVAAATVTPLLIVNL